VFLPGRPNDNISEIVVTSGTTATALGHPIQVCCWSPKSFSAATFIYVFAPRASSWLQIQFGIEKGNYDATFFERFIDGKGDNQGLRAECKRLRRIKAGETAEGEGSGHDSGWQSAHNPQRKHSERMGWD